MSSVCSQFFATTTNNLPVILFNTLSELQIFTRFFVGGFCFGFLLFLNMRSSIQQSNLLNSDLKITSSPSFPLCFKLVRVMSMGP
jgi:hypothetical protein